MAELVLTFTPPPSAELIATRFVHTRLSQEVIARLGSYDRSFRWTAGVQSLVALLLRTAAWWRSKKDRDLHHPCLEGRRPSPAASLNDVLTSKPRWVSDIFGEVSGRPVLCHLIGRWNADFNTSPNAPVRVWLETDELPAEYIKVVIEGRCVEGADELCVLADDISRQWKREKGEAASKQELIAAQAHADDATAPTGMRVSVGPEAVRIEIVLDRAFDSFGPEEEATFIEALRQLFNASRQLRVKGRRRGSVVLTLELTPNEVNGLVTAFRAGLLAYFGVLEIRRTPPDDRAESGGYWSPHEAALGDGSPRANLGKQVVANAEGHPWENAPEIKRLEEQLRQSQKMEAIGHFAGGIAHDFNNLLTVINGYSDMLAQELPPGDPRTEAVTQILEAGQRAAVLTQQILSFSRKTVVVPRVLDINEVVAQSGKLLHRLIGESIDVVITLSSRPIHVRADQGQLEQVLMNLVVNARDAMPNGGRLMIETRNFEHDETQTQIRSSVPGGYVELVVTDTGIGMTDEVKSRIFEPFFTTKPAGQGTGLGLTMVRSIVTQNGGRVEASSKPGFGTTLTVLLPTVAGVEVATLVGEPATLTRGTETVLVVEDEIMLLGFARAALQQHGYKVLGAFDGAEAVRVVENSTRSVDLLVADVVMPGMNGREVAEILRKRRPELKVLYVSGYANDDLVRQGVREAEVAFLPKPFTATLLAQKVREVLDS